MAHGSDVEMEMCCGCCCDYCNCLRGNTSDGCEYEWGEGGSTGCENDRDAGLRPASLFICPSGRLGV